MPRKVIPIPRIKGRVLKPKAPPPKPLLPFNYRPKEHQCKQMPGTSKVFTAKIGPKGTWGWWANDCYTLTCSIHAIYYCPWCGAELEDPSADQDQA